MQGKPRSMEKKRFALVAALAVVLLLAAKPADGAAAAAAPAVLFCGVTQAGLESCWPAVNYGKTAPSGDAAAPSAACCRALAGADLSCLCKFKNDNAKLLKSLNIDPKLATQLPAKCHLHHLPSKC